MRIVHDVVKIVHPAKQLDLLLRVSGSITINCRLNRFLIKPTIELFIADYYIVVEVDSYGHYFRKAKSKLVCRSAQPRWNESFTLDLEGSQNLRLLLYEDAARPVLRGKCTIKVNIVL